MSADPMLVSERRRIVELAGRTRVPTIYFDRSFAEAGGLLSYGTDLFALYRSASTYVDKIRKGAKPADLPVQQPAKFELVINLKTAKTLGLTIPPPILLRADRVSSDCSWPHWDTSNRPQSTHCDPAETKFSDEKGASNGNR
ncbi:MAG TPA: ABC transporter substrate binding protein [Burkholderiales bacterium]|nr:ABC transporter substrate binding protein [Burkholderiales bacterium]